MKEKAKVDIPISMKALCYNYLFYFLLLVSLSIDFIVVFYVKNMPGIKYCNKTGRISFVPFERQSISNNKKKFI
jgi:hypothetical protein